MKKGRRLQQWCGRLGLLSLFLDSMITVFFTRKNLLIGANFAYAASGYDEKAASLNHAISLPQQLQYFKEYEGKLNKVAGSKKAATIINGALYLLSAGRSDFVQNYYVNPFVNELYTPDQYGDILICAFTHFIMDVYGLGARKIGVTSRFT